MLLYCSISLVVRCSETGLAGEVRESVHHNGPLPQLDLLPFFTNRNILIVKICYIFCVICTLFHFCVILLSIINHIQKKKKKIIRPLERTWSNLMSSEKLFRKGRRETKVILFTVEQKGAIVFTKTARSSRTVARNLLFSPLSSTRKRHVGILFLKASTQREKVSL